MTDSISELLLEEAFLSYHRRFPKVQLEISLDTTVNLLERMRRGELDAACVITAPLPPTEWQIVAEREVPIVAAANPALPLARQKSVTLRELAEQELVMMETEAPYSIQFEQTMARQHLECKPVFRLQSAETALRGGGGQGGNSAGGRLAPQRVRAGGAAPQPGPDPTDRGLPGRTAGQPPGSAEKRITKGGRQKPAASFCSCCYDRIL